MDWKTLFLDANGRMGQRDFWIGFLILFVAGAVLGMIPIINLLAVVLIYPWVCVYAKRLHDFGKTGWLILAPLVLGFIGAVVAGTISGVAMLSGGEAGMVGAALGAGLVILVLFVVNVGFALWVGLSKGDPGENRYGPPPRSLTGGDTATVA